MRLTVRAKPGASRNAVGGAYAAPDGPELIVAVTARAVDGKATAAVQRTLAKALGCAPRDITLVLGTTSRSKVFDVPDECAAAIAELLAS